MLDSEYRLPQPSVTQALRVKTRQRRRGALPRPRKPLLDLLQIVAWADEHYACTGRWPARASGAIPNAPGETWKAVNAALCNGNRGLPEGGSLAQLLAARRGVRNLKDLCTKSMVPIPGRSMPSRATAVRSGPCVR